VRSRTKAPDAATLSQAVGDGGQDIPIPAHSDVAAVDFDVVDQPGALVMATGLPGAEVAPRAGIESLPPIERLLSPAIDKNCAAWPPMTRARPGHRAEAFCAEQRERGLPSFQGKRLGQQPASAREFQNTTHPYDCSGPRDDGGTSQTSVSPAASRK